MKKYVQHTQYEAWHMKNNSFCLFFGPLLLKEILAINTRCCFSSCCFGKNITLFHCHVFSVFACFRWFSSVAQLCPTLCNPWTEAEQSSLSIINSLSFLKLTSTESVMPSNHLILCCPLLLPPWIFPSIRVFSNDSALHIRWPEYWSLSFSISPSNEYSGLISFTLDWVDILAVQGSLESLLQHHTFKSLNFLVLSFLYSPTLTSICDYWKNHSFDYMHFCQ